MATAFDAAVPFDGPTLFDGSVSDFGVVVGGGPRVTVVGREGPD